ncbi:7-cyano-7-deazaguanine synthase [uncultured Gammaproteobacteria bacterium]
MTATHDQGALVLLSGGQDSATCLAWALDRFATVETIGFDYGQRHAVELDCRVSLRQGIPALRNSWNARIGSDHTVDLRSLAALGATAMTEAVEIRMTEQGLPNTFVPGRNLLFFTYAAAVAYRRGLRHLVGGMCETDYSGYPDCRDDTLKALQVTLNLGMDRRFILHTPLMWINKAETWSLAEALGGRELVELIRDHSHSCYLGDRSRHHDWGLGCGGCPACELRRRGWEGYIRVRQ